MNAVTNHLVKLAGISRDIRKFTGDIADATDRHFEYVAVTIKDKLAAADWLPQSARPPPPPPPRAISRPPPGYIDRVQDWVSRNRAITAAIVAFVGTGAFLIWRKKKGYNKKRRARRATNGARREVIGMRYTHDCV